MPFLSSRHYQNFRNTFQLPNMKKVVWFPGHMAQGMKKMQSKLKSVDCIIEVHDARIPFSGRNSIFKQHLLGIKPHILVLNKIDLFDRSQTNNIKKSLRDKEGITDIVFSNCRKEDSQGIKDIMPILIDRIRKSDRFNRSSNHEYGIMIIGVPNVGKSSLINSIRTNCLKKSGVAHVGAKAGITKAVQTRIKVSNSPPVFVYDTPGILAPNIPNVDVGMKLALCATLNDSIIGYITIADFLLYWCNKNKWYKYLDFFDITEPSDNIYSLLLQYAVKKNMYDLIKSMDGNGMVYKPALVTAASRFVETFRKGTLGPVLLDKDVLDQI